MAVALTLAVLGWWALPRGAAPVAAAPGDAYVGAVEEPTDLNPFTTHEQVARRQVLRFTHDALLELDPATAELRDALAERWELQDGGARAVFTLRQDVQFSDGTPLRIDDVLFTWQVTRDPGMPLGALREATDLLRDVRVLDARRIELSLVTPDPITFAKVATSYVVVSRAHVQREIARRANLAAAPVPVMPGEPGFAQFFAASKEPGPGTGPYAVAQWRHGIDLDLTANSYSWARRGRLGTWQLGALRLRFLRDAAAQLVALRRQEIDWLIDPDPLARLAADPQLALHYRALVYESAFLGTYVVLWNCRRALLADAGRRRSLTMLFDRDGIARGLLAGHAAVPAGWFRAGHAGHDANSTPLPFDVATARTWIGATPAEVPRTLALLVPSEQPLPRQIAEFAAPAFARAGVALAVAPLPWSLLQDRLRGGDFDGAVVVLGGDVWQDPWPFFHSSQRDGGRNWMGYADAGVDRLLDAARTESDGRRRAELQRQIEARLRDEQPMTLLLRPLATVLLHRRFRSAEPGPLGLVPERWWVPLAEQKYR